MRRVVSALIVSAFCCSALSGPQPNTFVSGFNFFLDSSLASVGVTINKVFIPIVSNVDFNKYIVCGLDGNPKPPIHIYGMDVQGYSCTQTAQLDLKTGQSYGMDGYIEVDANGQSVKIDQYYNYCPWPTVSNPHDRGCSRDWLYEYFIYIDPDTGKLSYRLV